MVAACPRPSGPVMPSGPVKPSPAILATAPAAQRETIMRRRMRRPFGIAGSLAVALAALAAPLSAQGSSLPVFQRLPCEREPGAACHELAITMGAPGGRRAEVTLFFERAFNLTPNSFVVQASEVAANDLSVQERLPSGVFVNPRFPLLFSIAPNPNAPAPVRFRGAWRLELETEAIEFDGEAPTVRLFHAKDGNSGFADLTQTVGFGSYRVRGDGGDFSQFLLVTDLRPPVRIANAAYGRVEGDITAAAIAGDLTPGLASLLRADLKASRDAFDQGPARRADALRLLNVFIQRVVDNSGGEISDLWDRLGPGSRVSHAGVLRGDAAALRLSIELATRPQSQAQASLVKHLTTASGRKLDVILEFPNEVGDVGNAFDVTATDVSAKDPALLARLPRNVTIPSAFPVLVKITPKPGTRPAFRGAFTAELRTRNLELVNNSPLRLFKAPHSQGQFVDITNSLAIGSYRVRGDGGDFSELLIVNDKRTTGQVISDKFDRLEDQLDALEPQITSATVFGDLVDLLAAARNFANRKKQTQAIDTLEAFLGVVAANSGDAVPDLFRQGDRSSGAGLLTSAARSIQLTLTLQKNGQKSGAEP